MFFFLQDADPTVESDAVGFGVEGLNVLQFVAGEADVEGEGRG